MLIWALLACPVPEFSRLTERVLFGRRQTELREVSERKVRLMPPKLQVPLYSLVMQACLCLQVMFLLSLNSNSIRHPFLIRLYQEGLEPLSFFVPWTTSLGHLFLTFFMVETQLHNSSFLFVVFSLPQLPQHGYCCLVCDCTLLIEAWPPRLGLGTRSDLVAFHNVLRPQYF